MNEQETLDRYVRRILKEKSLSLSDVERRAGGGISDSYICGIVNGNFGSLTVAKLKALAFGLGVPEDEIFAVARGIPPQDSREYMESEFASLFSKFKSLTEKDKLEVVALLEMIDREIERRRLVPKLKMRIVNSSSTGTHESGVAVAEAVES